MRDLTQDVQNVFAAIGVEAKKAAVLTMIQNSHAKATTKQLMTSKVAIMNNANRLDKFAADYMMSGEGMKV